MDTQNPFVRNVQELRQRARKHIEQGAVTDAYGVDRERMIAVLNEALATEIVCVLRYKRHHFMASGIHAQSVAKEFLEHADEEQDHADQIASRIVQLGGAPNLNPDGMTGRAVSEYIEADGIVDMLKENLIAERIAIDSYRDMIQFAGTGDPTTRRMLEGILAVEEEHADELNNLLAEFGPAS